MATVDPNPDLMARWIESARLGSESARDLAIESCRAYLMLLASAQLRPNLRAKAGASDVVQMAIFEAIRDFKGFSGSSEAELRAWLRRILVNNVKNAVRHYQTERRDLRREVPLDGTEAPMGVGAGLASATTSPSGRFFRNETISEIREALGRLPERERQILTWERFEDLTFEEIGRRIGCSPTGARKAWLRALLRLKRELGAPEKDPPPKDCPP